MSRINYDLTKIRGIAFDIDGVLSPATVPLGDDGIPRRMANLRDGYAMVCAVRAGIKMAIISGADAPGLRERFKIIGIEDIYLGAGKKLPLLKEWMLRAGLAPEETAYVGDDIPDLECLHAVGLPVSPRDGAAECRRDAVFISAANGGYGVARELLEDILRARGMWPGGDNAAATGI